MSISNNFIKKLWMPLREKQRRWIILSGLIVAFLVGFVLQNIGLFLPRQYLNHPQSAWDIIDSMSPWLNISYFKYGVIRRAFIGTLLAPLPEIARYITFVVTTLVAILFVFLSAVTTSSEKREHQAFLQFLIVIFIISPLGAMNFGWTFGRFEFINYVILIVCLYFSSNQKIILVSVLLTIGALVHEAFVFYGWPLIAVSLWSNLNNRENQIHRLFSIGKIFLLPVAVTLYLALYGNATIDALGADRELIQLKSWSTLDYALIFGYLLSLLIFHIAIYRHTKAKIDAYFLAPYFTAFLFILGIDYYRWVSIIFFIMFMAIFTKFLTQDGLERVQWRNDRLILIFSTILAIPFLGPIGVFEPFPAFANFLTLLGKL